MTAAERVEQIVTRRPDSQVPGRAAQRLLRLRGPDAARLENWTGVGAPPWTWPRDELLVDVAGKAVYAFVAGAVADRLADGAGTPPGERHAQLAGGRRLHDMGPMPGPPGGS